IIVASGANLDTHPDQVSSSLFSAGATVLCQNEIREEATFELLRRAKAGGARTMLNLAPAAALDPSRASHLDILVVNEIEAAMASGRETIGEDAAAFAADLARRLDLTAVITLGPEGAVAAGPDGRFRSSSLAIEPMDTTGAGDAFVGVLAAALDRGEGLSSALQWASVGAGLACTGLGAQTSQPMAADIEARLDDVTIEIVD
ncbi:MAG: PfkB family carbohydrate kinase, partial [Geminicoccaceae bacterium]